MKKRKNIERFKKLLLNKYNAGIAIGITMLGFAAGCKKSEKDDDNGVQPLYGMPSAHFIFNGRVMSVENDKAIQGIRVALDFDTVYTDSDGKFELDVNGLPQRKSFPFDVADVDGDENGNYRSMQSNVIVENPDFEGGDGSWDYGKTEKDIEIRLTPENE